MKIPKSTFYSFYGIGEDKDVWADAQYLDPTNYKPGEFEWWYVDGHMDDGVVFAVSYHLEVKEEGRLFSYLTVNITKGDEIISDVKIPVDPSQASYSKEECNVKLGNSYIKTLDGLNKFEVYVDPTQNNGNGLHVFLTKTVPTFSPTPRTMERPSEYFVWICSAPSCNVEGTITMNNEKTDVKGIGYHDHNWAMSLCP